jgi:hypothetical protein
MATEDLDELDKKIIKTVVDSNSRKPPAICEVIKPFLGERADRTLRSRVDRLSNLGYLRCEEYPGCVLVTATKKGRLNLGAGR